MRVKVDGRWVWEDTGYEVGQEVMADARLAQRRSQLLAIEEVRVSLSAPLNTPGPLTLRQYGTAWIAARKARAVDYAWKEEARFRDHIFPALGEMTLVELRPRHVRAFVLALKARVSPATGETLAPRTVRHIFFSLNQMCREAAADEVIPANPCLLKKGDLPAKRDKVQGWRAGAVLSPEECVSLMTNPAVPQDRRVQYALAFLTGSRPGEVAPRRWRDYDTARKPLGQIHLSTAWSTERKREKPTKTERERLVPVHPFLAKILAEWKLSGWSRFTGRGAPRPDDLILPARRAPMRNVSHTGKRFKDDLDALGFPKRRQYDSRRTFISWARSGGADEDMLKWITHSPGDVFDAYHSPDWEALCSAVLCVRIPTGTNSRRSCPKRP